MNIKCFKFQCPGFLAFLLVLFHSAQIVRSQFHTDLTGGLLGVDDYKDCMKEFREASVKPHPDIGLKADEILRKYGYPVEKINVVSEDGYILGMFRIPHGRADVSPLMPGERRKAVLLEHGFFCNSHMWIIQPYTRNLAMLLADSGFDVFLGNARGSRYSQSHIDPAMTPINTKYWEFSFHEMGYYDVPAQIETILNITGNEKLYYVGFSMGCTRFLIAMATHPELNNKIATSFLLAPAAALSNVKNWIRYIMAPLAYVQPLLRRVLGGRIDHIQRLFDFMGVPLASICAPSALTCGACSNIMYLICGYDAPQTNYTAIPLLANFFPETTSTKVVSHFAQNNVHRRFAWFDYGSGTMNMKHYGQKSPPNYKLESITAPTLLYYGPSDTLVPYEDVMELVQWMNPTTVKEINRVPFPLFNHADFLQAKDADDLLYKDIRDKIVNSTYG